MTSVIDRRPNGRNKSAVNRKRFLDRHKDQIKKSIDSVMEGKSIKDMQGGDVSIPTKGTNEPYFGPDGSGVWETVRPGNDEYTRGDRVRKPKNGGGRGNSGSDSEDIFEDEFMFTLSKEEFMKYFFDGLELPDLIKKHEADIAAMKNRRAGYTSSGVPTNLHILKSMKGALGRRIALGNRPLKELHETQEAIAELEAKGFSETDPTLLKLLARCKELEDRIAKIPFIDTFDIRYRNTVATPSPDTKAVMFCLMDVSGSMMQEEKDIAKRFFALLYLFLTKAYEKIELVFIRHHTSASEVTEHEFFHGRESGGTIVSSALQLTADIISARYSSAEYNIYVAQASDGDNFREDIENCKSILENNILANVQYMAYIEIADRAQELWDCYKVLSKEHKNLHMRRVVQISDIYPVFCDLFKKKGDKNG